MTKPLFNQIGVVLIANSVHNTSRLFKIARYLTEHERIGHLTIIGFWNNGLKPNEIYTPQVSIERKKTIKQKYHKLNIRGLSKLLILVSIIQLFASMLITCLKKKPEVIYCHDVLMLPVALLAKLFISSRIIYMPHELETEETGTGKIMRRILKFIERTGMRYVAHTTEVSPSIQKWYKNVYHTSDVSLIRNIPDLNIRQSTEKKLRIKLNLPASDVVFIYQGLIEKSRGVIELGEVFAGIIQNNKHIVFMGYGPEVEKIKEYSVNHKNIHYISAVDPGEIFSYTSDADVGVVFISRNISESYKHSLPNKYFEYITSGIPILISENLTSIEQDMNDNLTGWSIEASSEKLKDFIEKITLSDILRAKTNIHLAKDKYNWNSEASILLTF